MPTFEMIQEEIGNMLDVPDEELSDEQRAAMDEYLDMLADQEAGKVDSFARFIRLNSAMVEACKEESRRLAQKARAAQNRIDWLRGKYLATMVEHGLGKIRGNAYTLSVRKTEAVRTPETDEGLEELKRYDSGLVRVRVEMAANKTAIREAIQSGRHIPGCEIVTRETLQIR